MGIRRRCTTFLLTLCLLGGCLCTQPTRSHRQKRGIVKMMMHIMWDPVRLIRYWHAYDVTKEIAKSWRKILPTVLLLPYTENNPHSYSGIAKYVNPTVGFRDSKKKSDVKYYDTPHYQKSAGNIQPVAVSASYPHQGMPFPYAFTNDLAQQHFSSNQEAFQHHIQKDTRPIIVGHVPYGDDRGKNQHTVAHYYMRDGGGYSKEHQVSSSGVLYPGQQESIIHDDISSSPSQNVPRRNLKKRPPVPSHIHYVPHIGSTVHDDSEKNAPHILHPGQEFRIVLHPIPVSDFHPDSLKPSSEGNTVQFVPVPSKESFGPRSPILFKAVRGRPTPGSNTAEDGQASHANSLEDPDSEELLIDRGGISSAETKDPILKAKYNVTWVAQKRTRSDTERRGHDIQPDGTVRKVSSIHKLPAFKGNSKEYGSTDNKSEEIQQPQGLNRYNINMERLREDLKHGTPVLIPFNKNTQNYQAGNTRKFQVTNKPTITEETLAESPTGMERDGQVHFSGEPSGERKSTQKLLLFLTKEKEPPQ